ncbi:hypothetical protein BXA15_06410 [Campylobacter lari]|uniref:hypothetical protein n=1 Tax=Campylobacter lari TaxID=201 RepID=UPI001846D4BE|nr:hypothetical protein [Campylobacter lari]EAI3897257.1 hypothetical protein [Campylobacter lari]EAJ5697098.1 hypothetical protein [Campylobacter lari]EHC7929220.1 hypothetical protein [Campylobacter lari]MCR2078712.1 hypothetical protein [Campylobacter lari subsp. concheus]
MLKEKINTAIGHARALALINKECLDLIDYMEECDEDDLRSNLDDLKKLLIKAKELLKGEK